MQTSTVLTSAEKLTTVQKYYRQFSDLQFNSQFEQLLVTPKVSGSVALGGQGGLTGQVTWWGTGAVLEA